MNERVEDKLMQFIQNTLEPFTLKTLLRYLGLPVNSAAEEELESFLIYNQLAYLNPVIDNTEYWTCRSGLFTGKEAILAPTREEIGSGILIPGARLVPFCNPSILPHELVFTYRGEILPRTTLVVTPEEIYPHYIAFGDEYIPQYLALDNEENAELFSPDDMEDPASFSVQAVDMRNVYWGSGGFAPGDRIRARLMNWAEGVFDLEVLPAANIDPAGRKKWLSAFESALTQSFEINGPGASIDEQISFAYFLDQETLFSHNAATLPEFLDWSTHVSIESYGVETRLWLSDEEIPAQSSWNLTLVSAPVSLVEDAFVHLGLPLTQRLMESYVLDGLFRREKDATALLARMVPLSWCNTAFCLPVISRAVHSRFASLKSGYNRFADHDAGTLRNRFIALHHALMNCMFSLQHGGIMPDIIPDQGAVILGQLMSHTVSALESIDFPVTDEDADLEPLWSSIESMEDSFFDIRSAITEMMPELNKKRFSVIRKTEDTHD